MTEAEERLLAELQTVRDDYAKALPDKIAQLRAGLEALRTTWGEAQLQAMHRQAHSLTGSGATFGYGEVSRAARRLEQMLRQLSESGAKPAHALVEQIEPLLRDLEAANRTVNADALPVSTAFVPRVAPRPASQSRLIFVVDDDTSLAKEQRLQYELHGYAVREFHDLEGLGEAVRNAAPLAIIMDVIFPAGEMAGIEKVAALKDEVEAFPPVVFVSRREDLEPRLASVRAGAAAYFTKPLDIMGVIEALDGLAKRELVDPYRILIVDDDESLAYHNALLLQRAGMDVRVLTDPTSILELLKDFQPELILMDLYMPTCTGIELASVIRQDESYVGTPIVFFSVETDIEKHLNAMRSGGDDFLIKPIAPAHLLATVEARVRRARTLSSMMVRDSLTGLLNHTAIEEQLVRELGLRQRRGGELSYALIDLDHFKQINDRFGHAAGDRVIRGLSRLLRQRFRHTDLLGRYGGEEFVVVLPETSLADAAGLLDEVRDAFSRMRFRFGEQSFQATFSAGVAGAPPFDEAARLQGEADQALYRAKGAGRNRVFTAE